MPGYPAAMLGAPHVRPHLKNWKILKTGYHRTMTDFPDVLRTVTALEVFRTTAPGFE
jgi:hypothetical protein